MTMSGMKNLAHGMRIRVVRTNVLKPIEGLHVLDGLLCVSYVLQYVFDMFKALVAPTYDPIPK